MKISSANKSAVVVTAIAMIVLVVMFGLSLWGPNKLLLVAVVHNVDLQGLLLFVGVVLGLQAKSSNQGMIELAFFSGLAISVTSLFVKALPNEVFAFWPVAFIGIFLSFIFYCALVMLVYSSCEAFTAHFRQQKPAE